LIGSAIAVCTTRTAAHTRVQRELRVCFCQTPLLVNRLSVLICAAASTVRRTSNRERSLVLPPAVHVHGKCKCKKENRRCWHKLRAGGCRQQVQRLSLIGPSALALAQGAGCALWLLASCVQKEEAIYHIPLGTGVLAVRTAVGRRVGLLGVGRVWVVCTFFVHCWVLCSLASTQPAPPCRGLASAKGSTMPVAGG
jgi:hypothetical protein